MTKQTDQRIALNVTVNQFGGFDSTDAPYDWTWCGYDLGAESTDLDEASVGNNKKSRCSSAVISLPKTRRNRCSISSALCISSSSMTR